MDVVLRHYYGISIIVMHSHHECQYFQCYLRDCFLRVFFFLQASEDKWGTDESVFVKILTSRSTTQLQATFEAYKHVSIKTAYSTFNAYG